MCGSHREAWRGDGVGVLCWTMTQRTSMLCKVYLIKKESDGVLHQMTWLPQSPDLNPIDLVLDELDHRVKEKQPTSTQYMWELLQDDWKSIPDEAGTYSILVWPCLKFVWSLNLESW
ncbi:unnamed protein product [Oncorhynchus mykiss]|uniref:Tc1-like transposase DDE domain-containing protein n=1 Tax=Oncorhynchus mykiss TaxID=8022 RepID=A0A060W6F7_ONCMY|nr:unnamed protein product [Oncorhynchus mykiss]